MENELVRVSNAATLAEAEQLISLLRANSIRAEKREAGTGSYMTIMSNMSLSGYDIYVAAQDEERAKELLNEEWEEPENESQNISLNRKKIAIRIYAFIALALLVIMFVLLFNSQGNKQ